MVELNHDFSMTTVIFHDFPDLENSFLKFHDFPGYVGTLTYVQMLGCNHM